MSAFLPATFFPSHAENRMKHEGDVTSARERYLTERPTNLKFLLEQRYGWMNPYLEGKQTVVELGAGAGFSREFIRNPKLKLTDVVKNPWIDEKVDALALPYADSSVDAIVCSHMIHHLARPTVFFEGARRALKPGGLLVISEIHTSTLMRFLLRLARHEGWSYEVDVFDRTRIANDPADPWSANCAIPEMLFSDPAAFERAVPGFRVVRDELCECLIFPLSGGVIAKTKTVPLPGWVLKGIHHLDRALIRIAPRFFALGMRVVLEKVA